MLEGRLYEIFQLMGRKEDKGKGSDYGTFPSTPMILSSFSDSAFISAQMGNLMALHA